MTFKTGDFLEIEYSVWNAADNALVATTDEKKAKESGIAHEGASYGPALMILGSSGVIKGLDRELRLMAAGESKKFRFAPLDAFGERNESLVRVMPMAEFRKHDMHPYPGMQVNLDGVTAAVRSVNSGRVIVDANSPYAGRELVYEVKVLGSISGAAERMSALAKRYEMNSASAALKDGTATLNYKGAADNTNRALFVAAVFAHMPEVAKVVLQEEYERPKQKAAPAAKEGE